ncbi:MAG: YdcH family protein [Sphingomicrobium sp.]|nr:YdcH family protein [Sphingomonadales bacterium]
MEQAQMDPAYVEALTSKHAALQAQIDAEEHRPHPDETILAQLKKAKLKVKDVILGH